MALTQNDYRSILGSLRNSGINQSGELRLGAVVENLITPLNQSNIYNQHFSTRAVEDWTTTKWFVDSDALVTAEQGTLKTRVKLKPNTTYVVQVIDAVDSCDNLLEIFAMESSRPDILTFNTHAFFTTNSMEINYCEFTISGLSFSYKIIHKDENNNMIQLRNFINKKEARVFLFESNEP